MAATFGQFPAIFRFSAALAPYVTLDAGSDLLAPQHPLQLLEVHTVHLGAQGWPWPALPGLVQGEASHGMSLRRAPDVTLAAACPCWW